MADREEWGLRLFLAGMGFGLGLMFFVVAFNGSPFYQDLVAPTATEAMRPLGYVVEGGVLLSFAMTIAGIAGFSGGPSPAVSSRPAGATQQRRASTSSGRQGSRQGRKTRRPSAPHGST